MSSGSHLSRDLHDLIKAIGETRSKQEEDKIIIKEVQQLKVKLNEKNIPSKKLKEHLIRGIYIEMLGHDASFSHIHAVNLTQSKNLSQKKMGYLCCSLFLDSESELLILLVATLQKDLASTNVHIVVIALTAVAKLISRSFVTALVEPVLKLLTHNTDIIRKKAIMVLQQIRQLNPDSLSEAEYDERMRRGIQDKEPSVMGAAFNLYHEELKRGNIQKYKGQASNLVSMLKQVIEHKLHKDYDYHRFPAPWLQIKLLQILAILGANDLKVSEQIYEVLGSTLRRADDTTINIGYAVTYQCVKTIALLYPNPSLLEQAANSVSRFLKSENNNLKYLGINALTQIVSINPKYVVEHQMTVVDCLESHDDTLKKETLELLFRMTNENNFEVIIQKLLHFLKTSNDPAFRKDLFIKISLLNEKNAPTQEWFIRTANTVFEFGPEFIDNEVRNNFFKLLVDNFSEIGNEFGEFIVEIYLDIIQKPDISDNIIKLVCWVIGEIGSQTYDQDADKLNIITQAVIQTLDYTFEDETTLPWILTSLAKLQSARAFQMFDQTRVIFQKYQLSKNLDCQQRAIDFFQIGKYNAALKRSYAVNVDRNLSFLDAFVNAEKLKGAQPYNSSLQIKAAGLGGNSAPETSTLNFVAYKDTKHVVKPQFGDTNPTLVDVKKENNGLKQVGPVLWDNTGYNKEIAAPVVAMPKPITMAMGSQGNSVQNKPASTMQAIASTQVGVSNQPIMTAYVPPRNPVKEDPNLKEKQKFANSLFGPVTTQPTTNTGGIQRKGIQVQAAKPPQQQPQQTQVSAPVPQNNPMNLLDLDDVQQQQQSQQQQQQIRQQPQQQQYQPPQQSQPQPVFGQQQPQQQPKQGFQLPQSKPAQVRSLQPANLTLEQYEQIWESVNDVTELTLQTQIRTEQDFRRMIQLLNINIVEVIDTEIISAGLNVQTKKPILLYGNYHKSGELQLQMKANDPLDGQLVIQIIKQNFL